MDKRTSYERRLWQLSDQLRSGSVRHLSESLLNNLETDFNMQRSLFSEAEYHDPDFRDALLDLLLREKTVRYFPGEVATLVGKALGGGPALVLYSGLGEFLLGLGGGTGIEPNTLAARWSELLLAMSSVECRIVNQDPRGWQSNEKFDRIICLPPAGHREDFNQIFQAVFSRLSNRGRLALLVPPALLWGERYGWFRQLVPSTHRVLGVISLPPKSFAKTSVDFTLLLIGQEAKQSTFMAKSKSLADLAAIADDYLGWLDGVRITAGFESVLSAENWDAGHYEPIDFGLGEVPFSYRVLRLGEVATITRGTLTPQAKIAINRTGSKPVWLDDESELTEENSFFIEPKDAINPTYLYLYLSSSTGKRGLGNLIKGTTIPFVTLKDLQSLPIVVPELEKQSLIVAAALEIKKTTNTLESLAAEGRQLLSNSFFTLEAAREKFRLFSAETEKAFDKALPFPIAIVYRKVANAPNHTQRFSLLIELFEVVIRFLVLVLVADYFAGPQRVEVLAKIPELAKLSRPSLGNWVNLFRSLLQLSADGAPFVQELKTLRVKEYRKMIDEFVRMRNESFKGHGATLTEAEYERKFLEHASSIYDFVGQMTFLSNYALVKTGPMEKEGDFYRISAQMLMGDNPVFESQKISSRTPADTHKVLYLNAGLDPLILEPFVVLEPCTECHRPEVLMLDKFSDEKITYLGYESGHKPSYTNVTNLPSALRDATFRHS
jgi:hypothetical protein